jgi:hypothetical protein
LGYIQKDAMPKKHEPIKEAMLKKHVPKKERKQWVLRCPPKRETKMGTKVPAKSENKI